MQGWIKLHRKLLVSDVFQNEKLLKVFIYCLLKASHQDTETVIGLQTVPLKKGQFIFGRSKAASELNMKESTVWRYMKFLEKIGTIDIKSNNKFSLVTVENWGFYQGADGEGGQQNEQQNNNKVTTNGQQMDTYKNGENGKNGKKIDYTPKIKDLLAAFNQKIPGFIDLNKRYWDVIRETRKTGKISKSVIYNNMKKWEKYSPVVIEYALTTHIHNHAGKREEYTLGIMRRTNEHEARRGLIKLKNKGGAMIENHQRDNPEVPQYDYGF